MFLKNKVIKTKVNQRLTSNCPLVPVQVNKNWTTTKSDFQDKKMKSNVLLEKPDQKQILNSYLCVKFKPL
jgi:hypothetical protein